MSTTNTKSGIKTKTTAYERFMGLDTSRDKAAMETGSQQHLVELDNGYCDWRGQIVRNPAVDFRAGDYPVLHTRFYAPGLLAWAERRGDGIHFNTDAGHHGAPGWPANAIPASTMFNQRVHMFARGLQPWSYNGAIWEPNPSVTISLYRPAYAVAVQRRLAVAGIIGRETRVEISRVDSDSVFSDDEDPASQNVLRAGFIDVGNQLGSADQITGLGNFEQDRLIIFTTDRALIYRIDPNIMQWTIEDRANIQVGCISHNSIVQAGTDVLFCSRTGIHSIQRSADNGITVFSKPMSLKIERLYRELVRSVADTQQITAVWDQDNSQYHVYFPQRGGEVVRCLTMTLGADEEQMMTGRDIFIPKWSTSSAFNARCGAILAGQRVIGTNEGVFNILDQDDEAGHSPELSLTTPMLWHGALDDTKESTHLVVQASGKGNLVIEAHDDQGRELGSFDLKVSDEDDDGTYPDVPLNRQFTLKFERRYRGLQLRFTSTGQGLLRIIGFAVVLRK